jgi:ribosomal protein S18 acetylase RimI-like enzyme
MNKGTENVAIFAPEVSPFVGLLNWDLTSQKNLYDFLPAGKTVSTLIAKPFDLSENWELIFSLGLYQMVCTSPSSFNGQDASILPLRNNHIPAMIELTALTKPGPFSKQTIEFGNYVGIFENDKLVAMAGERLHLIDFTEISAVCTHPSFAGKRYAATLVNHLLKHIHSTGKSAFLHVRQDNDRAIDLYRGLGFEVRSDMYFAVVKSKKE